MDFKNKNVLAPMVRVSTLPMRLLALQFGADYVYSEEIVDFKILRSVRVENDILGTIDYVMDDGTIVFRTCEKEKNKVVFQLATNDAERALKVGKIIQGDIAAIDLNMGCPKGYSTKGGMGAAMLKDPDNACKILKTLSDNLDIPVTCKIRIMPKLETTTDIVTKLANTGIAAIAVHGRYPDERPNNLVHDDTINFISTIIGNKVTVIANGGSVDFIKTHEDIDYFRQCCGVSSVMIARAAMWNPTIFGSESSLKKSYKPQDLIKKYLKLAVRYDNHLSSTKYCITQFLHEVTECPGFRETLSAGDNKTLCDIWCVPEYYTLEEQRRSTLKIKAPINSSKPDQEINISLPPPYKKMKLDDKSCVKHVHGHYRFNRRLYSKSGWSPKLALFQHCDHMKWSHPRITMEQDAQSKLFYCSVELNNILYTNEVGDKNKRFTEQAISCICLHDLGLVTPDLVEKGLIINLL